jgi:hypothetical protein
MAQAPEESRAKREPAEQLFAPRGALQEAAIARFLAGGRWRMLARWLGLSIFIFGALLLAWVFWQALKGFQNFTRPDYLSSQLNRVQGDTTAAMIVGNVVVFGTEFLRVLYLLLLGFLASVIAGKGIQFFAASEAIIDEAVVGDVE